MSGRKVTIVGMWFRKPSIKQDDHEYYKQYGYCVERLTGELFLVRCLGKEQSETVNAGFMHGWEWFPSVAALADAYVRKLHPYTGEFSKLSSEERAHVCKQLAAARKTFTGLCTEIENDLAIATAKLGVRQ